MKKPTIGITAGTNPDGIITLNSRYAKAVKDCGGLPVILSNEFDPQSLPCCCDGLILSGGGDILPELFGVYEYEPSILSSISPERDRFEIELARLAFDKDIPLFGICRGIQVMNVALGGSLLLDIKGHSQTLPRSEASHEVMVKPGTLLSSLIGEDPTCGTAEADFDGKIRVNSFHHQAIDRVAEKLSVSAVSTDSQVTSIESIEYDKVIEAIEAIGKHFFIGVQWHPEHLTDKVSEKLFKSFIKSAVERFESAQQTRN